MLWITLINALNALPTVIALILFFTMDRVTRHILMVRLLVPHRPILSDPFDVLSGKMRCDRIHKELWGRSTATSLTSIFFVK